MKIKISAERIDYLKRCKAASPESKLQWLESALEFAQAKKKIIKK